MKPMGRFGGAGGGASTSIRRRFTNARTAWMLTRTATGLLSTFTNITAPWPVKARGRYLRCSPLFKVAICDLKESTAFPSSSVNTQDYIIWIAIKDGTYPVHITRDEYLQGDWKSNIEVLLNQQ